MNDRFSVIHFMRFNRADAWQFISQQKHTTYGLVRSWMMMTTEGTVLS